jgi:peptidoglycan hydrolase-like protein with peptidoglycan-binding domain
MDGITPPLKQQLVRSDISELHAALTSLGYDISVAESASQRFGRTTRAAVLAFQAQHGLTTTGELDAATLGKLNEILAGQGVPDGPAPDGVPAAGRAVGGTVHHADGSPISDLTVRAYHRRVAGEDLLGEARTGDRGEYAIAYQLPAGVSAVDLFVRAHDDEQAIVAVSPIIIGAAVRERLTLTVEGERFRGPSEYARTAAAVSSQLAGGALDAIDADDVALLVRRTGAPRAAVTAWIASGRLANRTGVEHEALYALVRMANTASLPRLLRRSPVRLRRALERAARSNLVSHLVGRRADELVAQLQRVKVATSSSREAPGSLGRLLATAGTASPAQQREFIDRYARHRGPVRALWRALREDPAFGDDAVDDLQLSVQLGTLTANHAPMVAALRASGVRRASEAATLDAEQWRGLASGMINGLPVGAPASIRGATEAERIDNYVTLLTERAALAFPTTKVAGALRTLPGWQESPAVAFLDANPAFDLTRARIGEALASGTVVLDPRLGPRPARVGPRRGAARHPRGAARQGGGGRGRAARRRLLVRLRHRPRLARGVRAPHRRRARRRRGRARGPPERAAPDQPRAERLRAHAPDARHLGRRRGGIRLRRGRHGRHVGVPLRERGLLHV